MQALNGHRHRPRAPRRPVPAGPRAPAQKLRHLLQLPQRLGLDRLNRPPVRQHPLQLPLPPPQRLHRRRLVQIHRRRPPQNPAASRAKPRPRLQRQDHGMNRLARRLQQQARNILRPQLMRKTGAPPLVSDFPEIPLPAQRIRGRCRMTGLFHQCLLRHIVFFGGPPRHAASPCPVEELHAPPRAPGPTSSPRVTCPFLKLQNRFTSPRRAACPHAAHGGHWPGG